jgi:hypothetical protein
MRVNLISISHLKTICPPDTVIEQCQLGNFLELQVKENCLEIHQVKSLRMGWEEKLTRMAKCGDDQLLNSMFKFFFLDFYNNL